MITSCTRALDFAAKTTFSIFFGTSIRSISTISSLVTYSIFKRSIPASALIGVATFTSIKAFQLYNASKKEVALNYNEGDLLTEQETREQDEIATILDEMGEIFERHKLETKDNKRLQEESRKRAEAFEKQRLEIKERLETSRLKFEREKLANEEKNKQRRAELETTKLRLQQEAEKEQNEFKSSVRKVLDIEKTD